MKQEDINTIVRHKTNCGSKKKGRYYSACGCPVYWEWMEDAIGKEGRHKGLPCRRPKRVPAGMNFQEAAANRARALRIANDELQEIAAAAAEAGDPTLARSVQLFLDFKIGAAGGKIKPTTLNHYQRTLHHLADYLATKHLVVKVNAVKPWMLSDWQNSWHLKTYAGEAEVNAGGKYSYVWNNWVICTRAFFNWCVARDYILKSPAIEFKVPGKVGHEQTMPYSDKEIGTILAAVEKVRIRAYDEFRHHELQPWPPEMRARIRALIQTMLWTGMAIRDATKLERTALQPDNRVFLRRAKTGVPVCVPVPPNVAEEIRAVKNGNMYFFWNSTSSIQTAVNRNQDYLGRVFRTSGIEGARSHRFRDTFAIRCLERGMTVDDVAMLLGNTPQIVRKHYKAWVDKLQQQLEERLKKAWETMPGFESAAV